MTLVKAYQTKFAVNRHMILKFCVRVGGQYSIRLAAHNSKKLVPNSLSEAIFFSTVKFRGFLFSFH